MLLAFVLIATFTWFESVNAGELGRLFNSPQQRKQLESQETNSNSGSNEDGTVRRSSIIVNGVVQKKGGNRTIWVNGVEQEAGPANDKNPSTASVNVQGKSQPVQLKVGERLLLDTAAPAEEEK